MGRKQIEINPESGKRLLEWLKEADITQSALAERIGYSQQHISHIATGKKRMTRDFAEAVSEKALKPYPEHDDYSETRDDYRDVLVEYNRVRPEYLLGEDNYKTKIDASIAGIEQVRSEKSACRVLLESSIKAVCLREGIPIPEISINDFPKLLFLEAQLLDFSDSLAWHYLRGRDKSHVWEQLEEHGFFGNDERSSKNG